MLPEPEDREQAERLRRSRVSLRHSAMEYERSKMLINEQVATHELLKIISAIDARCA